MHDGPRGGSSSGLNAGDRLAAARRGLEFQQALRSSVTGGENGENGGRTPSYDMSMGGLPQRERVHRLGPEIKALFTAYDDGRMGSDVFRQQLRELGLAETPATRRLLRTNPTQATLTALLRALCATDEARRASAENRHFFSDRMAPHWHSYS